MINDVSVRKDGFNYFVIFPPFLNSVKISREIDFFSDTSLIYERYTYITMAFVVL